MGKNTADTSGRADDPDLAPDAALAKDLGDDASRLKEQLSYYGGEEDDDIDEFDPSGLDDGSSLDGPPAKAEDDKSDEKDDEKDDEKSDDDEKDDEKSDDDEKDDEKDEEEEKSEKPSKAQGIPKHRFDEVNERRKKAEDELARLKSEREAEEKGKKEEYDFDKAETEYMDLLLEGKTEEALAKRKEIRAAEKSAWTSETKSETRNEISQQEAIAEVTQLTTQAEKMFPVFDQEHDDFDPEITNKVLAIYRGYIGSGEYTSMGDAFVSALADVVQLYDLETRYLPKDDKGAKDDKKDTKPTGKKRDDEKTRQKDKQREQAHQPVAGKGENADTAGQGAIDIENMTDEELDALPPKTLARLRGDIL